MRMDTPWFPGLRQSVGRCGQWLASAGRICARPGAVAWAMATGLLVSALFLATSRAALVWAALVPPSVLVGLATARAWQARRLQVESLGLLVGFVLVGVCVERAPGVVRTAFTPPAMLGCAGLLLSWCEWQFAPDHGQIGRWWAWEAGVRDALWVGFGIGFMLVLLLAFGVVDGWRTVGLGAGGLLGHGVGRWGCPPSRGPWRATLASSKIGLDSAGDDWSRGADWWKDR